MGETSSSETVSTKLQRIAEQAVRYPDMVFTTLTHLIDVDFLREAHRRTRKDRAPGFDKVTAKDYAEHLEENLCDLHERLVSGRYVAPPVERVWLDKEDGSQRPIGKPTFEDKIVQRAVVMLLGAIYEQDFHDFSYGFREGRSQHQALHALREQCMEMNIKGIVDADVSGCFDNIDHRWMLDIIRRRVNDGGILRLIGKWLHAGVMEGGVVTYPDRGTPQGGVVSPMLSNIFLHHVLDEWYVRDVRPRMRGRSYLIRFADDFLVGCESEDDARRVMEVLPKRLVRFGLSIHPEKTALIAFGKPDRGTRSDTGNGTFDFLGFTHYWMRSRRGYWVIKRRTARKRLRRAMKSIWQWCRRFRHIPLQVQHATLCRKLRGYYQYYGIRGNFYAMKRYLAEVERAWQFWLHRRSSKKAMPWARFRRLLKQKPLPTPRIIHSI